VCRFGGSGCAAASVLAADRGIQCVTLDYDAMRGIEPGNTLF
jgi:endonuclease